MILRAQHLFSRESQEQAASHLVLWGGRALMAVAHGQPWSLQHMPEGRNTLQS